MTLIVAKMGTKTDFETAAARVFSKIFGTQAHLEHCQRLSGGASQETWSLRGDGKRAILRRAPGGVDTTTSSTAIGLPSEAALLSAVCEAGVPVPKIEYVLSTEDGLGTGFVMAHVEGETIARKILRDPQYAQAREGLARQCGEALARIHAQARQTLPSTLRVSDAPTQLEEYEVIFRSFAVSRPIFELAFQVLKAHQPSPSETVLVHGDFRLGNLMVDTSGLVAVLDWELAHLGDPREDLAWICVNSWRFGQRDQPVGGFGRLEDMLDAYQAAGGIAVPPSEVVWWELLGTLKWGIMCMIMYEAFRTGADASVERAAIGRRVSETEIDLINLLEAHYA